MKTSIQFNICCCEILPVFLPMKTRCLAALKLSDTGLAGALNGVCASRPVIPSSSPMTRKSYYVSSHFVSNTIIWFSAQNWISLASFAHHMFLRSDESLQSFPAQNNPTRKISKFSIFEFFSRPSVALSTGIEFPLGTTSFYLAAWCRCALK